MQRYEIEIAPFQRGSVFSRLSEHTVTFVGGKKNLIIETTPTTAMAIQSHLRGLATITLQA